MSPGPVCQQPATKRNGVDRRGRQKYLRHSYRRTFTEHTASAFSGYRWPADVILTAVRWYLAYPLSSRQVLELLAEGDIDVSHRTVLDWAQAFGPQLAAEVRRNRGPVGKRWFVDEVFLFRKGRKRELYRAIDEDRVVVDVLLHEHRDTASAQAFFRQANALLAEGGKGSLKTLFPMALVIMPVTLAVVIVPGLSALRGLGGP